MNPKAITKQNLDQVNIMQLATVSGDQPWACNVHFYSDDDLNFYWISSQESNHSKHIATNSKVGAAILIHENTADENYSIGLSIEGTAEIINPEFVDDISQAYANKLSQQPQLVSNSVTGESKSRLYKLTPTKIVLIDTKNFPDKPRQELELGM